MPEVDHRQELEEACEELRGMSPKQIAAKLVANRIKGRPGTTGRCPLAMHMHATRGGQYIVGQTYIMRRSGDEVVKIKTPENLASFVRMFDAGQFSELMMPPPRCVSGGGINKNKKPPGKVSGHKPGRRRPVRLHLAREVGRHIGGEA